MIQTLSIIIPVYNEQETISRLLSKITSLILINNIKKQIIIIDDCSTDLSKKEIKLFIEHHPKYNIIYHSHEENQGKGGSIISGLKYVSGEYIIIQDADLEYDPADINKLLKIAEDEKKDFVIGHRIMKTTIKHPYFFLENLQ